MKRFLAGATAGVAVLAFAGACGIGEQARQIEPKLELRDAAKHLAEAKQAGFTVKLTGGADALIAGLKLQAQQDKSAEDSFTDEDADMMRKVVNSSATIAYDRAGDGPEDDRSQLSATVDGVTGTEIRFIDSIVYAKVPVTDLMKKFDGGDPEELRKSVTAGMPEAGALFDGKWIAVDSKQAGALGANAGGLPTQDLDSAKTITELQASLTNLVEGADVVRDSADEHHLIVTSSTTKAYEEVKRLSKAVSTELNEDLSDAPEDKPVVVDLWVDEGKFTAAEVNILQFIDGAAGRAAVRIEVTTGSEITAPQDATKIDLSGLEKSVQG